VTFSAPSVEGFFGPKQTALGEGYFITISQDVTDQNGEAVALMRHRFIRFRPNEGMEQGGGQLPQPLPYRPATETLGDMTYADGPRLDTITLAEVSVGATLPPLVVELTPTMIVAGAIATQDYQNVHHDRDAVQRLGHPDVFMNILTSTGFAGRFVTDWAGPEARLEAATVRLGVPNYPYDEMRIEGTVAEKRDDGRVIVSIVGTNRLGKHLDCQITMALPK
jgi:acyl dehydratase